MLQKSIWIALAALFTGTEAGKFAILHTPPSLQFVGEKQIQHNMLRDVFSIALGLSTDKSYTWNEMKLVNPFDTPECVAVVHVDGARYIGVFEDAKFYPMATEDALEPDVYDFMVRRISMLHEPKCKLVNMRLSGENDLRQHSDIFGEYTKYKQPELTLNSLTYYDDLDGQFLRELHVLKAITAAVKNGDIVSDGSMDFFTFRISSLRSLIQTHGPRAHKTKEAKILLNLQIRELTKAFVECYDGKVLVSLVLMDNFRMRRRRQEDDDTTTETTPTTTGTTVDDSDNANTTTNATDSDVPESKGRTDQPILHIIFWTSVALFFCMIAIVYTIISMDPGRDSVVYRMTSAIDRVKME